MGNPRYANGHRRRMLRRRVLAEENTCALCHQPVDKTLTTPHPLSAEVDEILPLSLGGDPLLRSNVQLTHRACNQAKSNQVGTAKAARHGSSAATTTTAVIPTSRPW